MVKGAAPNRDRSTPLPPDGSTATVTTVTSTTTTNGPDDVEGPSEPPDGPSEKLVVKLADGSTRRIQYIATTTYWSADGRPISADEFIKRLFGDLSHMVANEDELRGIWSDPANREHFLTQLDEQGYSQDRLQDIRHLVDATDSDLFDVLAFIMFENSLKTREDRASFVRSSGLQTDEDELREFLLGILKAYEKNGEGELGTSKLGGFLSARYGSVNEGKAKLGDLAAIRQAFVAMQRVLYTE